MESMNDGISAHIHSWTDNVYLTITPNSCCARCHGAIVRNVWNRPAGGKDRAWFFVCFAPKRPGTEISTTLTSQPMGLAVRDNNFRLIKTIVKRESTNTGIAVWQRSRQFLAIVDFKPTWKLHEKICSDIHHLNQTGPNRHLRTDLMMWCLPNWRARLHPHLFTDGQQEKVRPTHCLAMQPK